MKDINNNSKTNLEQQTQKRKENEGHYNLESHGSEPWGWRPSGMAQ